MSAVAPVAAPVVEQQYQAEETLVSHSTRQGNGQRGPFAIHIFKSAAGVEYSTTKQQLADIAYGLLNQPITLLYTVHPNTSNGVTYENRRIANIVGGSLAPGTAPAGAPTASAPINQGAPTGGSGRSSGWTPEKEYTVAFAGYSHDAPMFFFQRLPEDQQTKDNYVKIVDWFVVQSKGTLARITGSAGTVGPQPDAATPAASPVPVEPQQAAIPVAAPAPPAAPQAADDDIPF